MRYRITHRTILVGEVDQLDLANAILAAGLPIIVTDTWNGQVLQSDQPAVSAGISLPWSTIDQMLREGRKIHAIKLIREVTQLGLGEAKAVADKRQVELAREDRLRGDF